jgi:hypothetical protein
MDERGKERLAVAERRDDNSPAFQCRGKFGIANVPQGRLKTPYRIRGPVFVEINFSRTDEIFAKAFDCSEGTFENSPAFQCRVGHETMISPEGTTEVFK